MAESVWVSGDVYSFSQRYIFFFFSSLLDSLCTRLSSRCLAGMTLRWRWFHFTCQSVRRNRNAFWQLSKTKNGKSRAIYCHWFGQTKQNEANKVVHWILDEFNFYLIDRNELAVEGFIYFQFVSFLYVFIKCLFFHFNQGVFTFKNGLKGELNNRKSKSKKIAPTAFDFGESSRYWNAEFENTWQTIQSRVDVSSRTIGIRNPK